MQYENKAVFLDRDGVIIRERGDFTWMLEDVSINPGVEEALKTLCTAGFLLIVISNQSGIAKEQFIFPSGLYWLQNFLFISALAIVFDIKDHSADMRYGLKTYPALLGISKTLYMVVVPITLLSLGSLFLYEYYRQLPFAPALVQTIPYILLLTIIPLLKTPRSTLFYLTCIDGLMLAKGLCGIISILFF